MFTFFLIFTEYQLIWKLRRLTSFFNTDMHVTTSLLPDLRKRSTLAPTNSFGSNNELKTRHKRPK